LQRNAMPADAFLANDRDTAGSYVIMASKGPPDVPHPAGPFCVPYDS